jgi:two-component system, NtrC family, sensor kinase
MEDVLALNNRAIVEKNLDVHKRWSSDICMEGFPAQLRQVFSNILRNAIDASENGGKIHIRISRSFLGPDFGERAARVTIADRGIGIAKENVARVFDAFFTTKELKGTGVGLWLSSTIVHQHGGRIQLKTCALPDRTGTSISVVLPMKRKFVDIAEGS